MDKKWRKGFEIEKWYEKSFCKNINYLKFFHLIFFLSLLLKEILI